MSLRETKSPKPDLSSALPAQEPDESAIEMGSPLKTQREEICGEKETTGTEIIGKVYSKEENPAEESKEEEPVKAPAPKPYQPRK